MTNSCGLIPSLSGRAAVYDNKKTELDNLKMKSDNLNLLPFFSIIFSLVLTLSFNIVLSTNVGFGFFAILVLSLSLVIFRIFPADFVGLSTDAFFFLRGDPEKAAVVADRAFIPGPQC